MMKNTYVSIDHKGSLRDFYLLALDDSWWNKMVARILDPSIPLPDRPNDGFASSASSEESQNDSSRTNMYLPRGINTRDRIATVRDLREKNRTKNRTINLPPVQIVTAHMLRLISEKSCETLLSYLVWISHLLVMMPRPNTDYWPPSITPTNTAYLELRLV